MKRMSDKLTGRDFLQARDSHARPVNGFRFWVAFRITRACWHSSSLMCLPQGQLRSPHLPALAMSLVLPEDWGHCASQYWHLNHTGSHEQVVDARTCGDLSVADEHACIGKYNLQGRHDARRKACLAAVRATRCRARCSG